MSARLLTEILFCAPLFSLRRHRMLRSVDHVSPGRSPLRGNLTGLPRKIRDTCASWHDYVQKWKLLIVQGADYMTQICNKKLSMIEILKTDQLTSTQNEMPDGMQQLCEQLEGVVKDFEIIISKMRIATDNLKGITELDKKQSGDSSDNPLFQTWPTELFYSTAQLLLAMYVKECELKRNLMQSVAFVNDHDTFVFYNSAWLHEPYIEANASLLLESMLVETGLK